MTATWAGRLGSAGALLLVAAGVVQVVAGRTVPAWTGDKAFPVPLGLLTVALGGLALLAARRAGRQQQSPAARAVAALGTAGPGLLCLSTVGRLAWIPAVLLVAAALLAVGTEWRGVAAAVAGHRWRVLLGALGCCQWLVAAAAAPVPTVAAVAGGAALLVAAVLPRPRPAVLAVLVAVGVVPLALVGWAGVVPLVVALVALPVAVGVARAAAGRGVSV
ncbi:hypothetical protein GCM10023200_58630 [Actinomycetospora chlora]|uniref:Uncharacterized protein n=1 Tax=Actinomycetospora chlora TaxID=663608 RepID=A0ABP9CN52_9PSEU